MWHDTIPCAERIFALRHDPASAAVVVMLRGLKMYGMAQAADDLIEQGAPAFGTAVPFGVISSWPMCMSGLDDQR